MNELIKNEVHDISPVNISTYILYPLILQMEKWRVYLSVVLLVASIDPNFGTLSKSDKKHKVGTF